MSYLRFTDFLDGISLGVRDDVMIDDNAGVQIDHLFLGGDEYEYGVVTAVPAGQQAGIRVRLSYTNTRQA